MNEIAKNDYLTCLLNSFTAQSVDILSHESQQNEKLSWLKQLRAEAIDQAGQLTLPTTKDEEWRFTDISPLAKLPFKPAKAYSALELNDIQPFLIEEANNRLVFVDGYFAPDLSNILGKDQLIIGNLSSLTTHPVTEIKHHLGQQIQLKNNIFTALNTAFLQDGAFIVAPKNITVSKPIHLLFIATQKETTNYPRVLVVGKENSEITIIEDYVALQDSAANDSYITNSVVELNLAANAQVQHIRIQRENPNAFHLANSAVSLDHASRYQATSITLGAQISRYDLNISFISEAAECAVHGLTMVANTQLADTHTCIDHLKPNCTSRQQHKCIADDSSRAVFNGKIIVSPNAQRTNSSQSSRNLLLSGKAQIDTKPQLEIFADDVKCAHGATVGQLDNEEIFYLKSRGLPELVARNLLTYAFGAEILDHIPVKSLKHKLEQIVLNQTQSS
ncbi:MAG: Fe-S cluster assembly protein SufD [Nitrosomonas sp.]|nr:Fe-S cluster assembly protein SufD [Nitrosomonas sp.]